MATKRSTMGNTTESAAGVNRQVDNHAAGGSYPGSRSKSLSHRTIAQIKFLVVLILVGLIVCYIWYSRLNASYQEVLGM